MRTILKLLYGEL